MAQLRLGYSQIEKTNAEILQISHNTAEEAARYFRHYPMTFPYLCDPGRVVHERYGIVLERLHVSAAVASAAAAATDLLLRGDTTPSPLPYFRRYPGKDSPQAVFVVDRDGIVRAVHASGPNSAIPSTADLVRQLAALT